MSELLLKKYYAETKKNSASLADMIHYSKDFINVGQYPKELCLLGDSISEGYYSTDRQNRSYAGIIRTAFMEYYNTQNYGFENFNLEQTKRTVRTGMTFTESDNATLYGGRSFASNAIDQYLEVKTICKDFRIVYKKTVGGAVLNVLVDDIQTATIDTSITPSDDIDNACFSSIITASQFSQKKIKLVNSDGNPCTVMGIVVLNDSTKNEPIFQNTGLSSIRLQDISNDILDVYCKSNNIIFALGRNDDNGNYTLFASKVDYVLNKIKTNNGNAIVCDYYFNDDESVRPCKQILREKAALYGFKYLDFQKYSYGNISDNVSYGYAHADQIHPLDKGHVNIARTILNELGIPYIPIMKGRWTPLTLQNGWTPFGNGYSMPEYMIDRDNIVHLRGFIKGGTTTANTTIALITGIAPVKTSNAFGMKSDYTPCAFTIMSNGQMRNVTVMDSAFTCLDGITYSLN